MLDSPSSDFPLPLNWTNYRDRLTFLCSTATFELATAGWTVRIGSLAESPFTPYIHYLLEDNRARDGVSNGISKEREEESGLLDHCLPEMATNAWKDPEILLESLFICLAAGFLRTQPIESEAISGRARGHAEDAGRSRADGPTSAARRRLPCAARDAEAA